MKNLPFSKSRRPIRVLTTKIGLDGHDRGILIITRSLRDAGMEVVYLGIHRTPEEIVQAAIEEDVDVIAISILSGAHMTLLKKVRELLNKQGGREILLMAGGVIPAQDRNSLEKSDLAKVFGPGTAMHEIVEYIQLKIKN